MKKKSFTLIEILVALIVLSIIASVSVALYQKTVDTNNERICAENLKVLQAAIDIFTVENDALPAALALLTPRHIYMAYSRVAGERKENPISIAIRNLFSTKLALAGGADSTYNDEPHSLIPFVRRYINGKKKLFRDPAQGSPPTLGGCGITFGSPLTCGSYNFNFNTNTFDNTTNELIKDSPFALISDSGDRHRGKYGTGTYTIGVTPGGRVGKVLSVGGNVQ